MRTKFAFTIITAAACAVLTTTGGGPRFSERASAAPVAVFEQGCVGVQATIPVPSQNVRPLVPQEFAVATDANGNVSLGIGAVRCESVGIVGSPGRPTIEAHVSVAINNPELDANDVLNVEAFHSYHLWIAHDNPELTEFWREQAGGAKAVYVPDMAASYDPASGAFHLVAPEPAPSPFELDAVISRPVVARVGIGGNFWASSVKGGQRLSNTVKIPVDLNIELTTVPQGRIVPEPGSELAQLFCGHDGRFDDPLGLASSGIFFDSSYYAEVRPDQPLSPTGRAVCVAEQEDCIGVQAVTHVPAENLDPLVSDALASVEDHLEVVVLRCQRSRIGRAEHGALTFVQVAVGMKDIKVPQNQSPDPVLYPDSELDDYVLWVASDNEHYVRWLREQGGMRPRDAVVANLVFDLQVDPSCAAADPAIPTLASRLHFEAPAPSRSPMTIDACFGTPVAGPINFLLDHWSEVPRGLLTIPVTFDQFFLGQVSGVITPQPGSEIDRLFCGHPGEFRGLAPNPASEEVLTEGLSFSVRHRQGPALVNTALKLTSAGNAECVVHEHAHTEPLLFEAAEVRRRHES